MIVLVTGGRDYHDADAAYHVLDCLGLNPGDFLMHGDADGLDQIAGEWARNRGIHEIKVPALWKVHKRAAGGTRNAAMLALGPVMLIAFPGGPGTANMKQQARRAGLTIWEPDV